MRDPEPVHIDFGAAHPGLGVTRDTERVNKALPHHRDAKVISEDGSTQWSASLKSMDCSCLMPFQQVSTSSRRKQSLLKGLIAGVEGTTRAKSVLAEQNRGGSRDLMGK